MSGWQLDGRSYAELHGVHPTLIDCVALAVDLCEQPFAVHDGLRTLEEQKALVRAGASTTMNSKHLRQADGFGHAIDAVPLVNGKLRWEWPPIYVIAAAMHAAARRKGVALRWGAVWDRALDDLDPRNLEAEVNSYRARKILADKLAGRKPRVFTDGPHFEKITR